MTAARPATSFFSSRRIAGTKPVPTVGSKPRSASTCAGGPDRRRELRASLVELHLDPHRREGDEDVGEEDDAVHPEAPEGLHRDLDGRRHVGAEVEEGEALAHLAVLGEVAAGLAHEPDGRQVHGAAEGGVDEALAGGAGIGHGAGG